MRQAIAIVLLLASSSGLAVDLDTACEALAPAAQVHVTYLPSAMQVDDSKRSRDIQLDGDKAGSFRQLGVTRATLHRDVDVRLEGFSDEQSGRACAWPSITVKLSVRPLLVELARELNLSECMRSHVLEHEMLHVAIYNASAQRVSAKLEQEMRAHFNERRLDGAADSMLQAVRTEVNERWLARLDTLLAESDREHDTLDAAEEQRAYTVCDGALARVIKALE
jgi:hypothetical protein